MTEVPVLHPTAAFEGTHEGDGVGMAEPRTGRHTLGDAGDGAVEGRELLCQVESGGFPLYVAPNG